MPITATHAIAHKTRARSDGAKRQNLAKFVSVDMKQAEFNQLLREILKIGTQALGLNIVLGQKCVKSY